jgi:hypothetical protein
MRGNDEIRMTNDDKNLIAARLSFRSLARLIKD